MKRLLMAGWAAALVVGVAAPSALLWRDGLAEKSAIAAQQQTIAKLKAEVDVLEAQAGTQADWVLIAAGAEPSVVTIETSAGLGSTSVGGRTRGTRFGGGW